MTIELTGVPTVYAAPEENSPPVIPAVRISVPENLDYDGLFDDLLDAYFTSCELIRVRTVEMGTAYQLIYRGTLQDPKAGKRFLDAVRERNGNLPVALGRIAEARGEM